MIWGIMVPANALFAVPDAATQAADRAGRRGGLRGYCRGSRAGLKYRAVLGMPHGAGLRASEVFSLKVSDIDGDRMLIHVDAGKGGKDRRVMLCWTCCAIYGARHSTRGTVSGILCSRDLVHAS